MILSPLNYISMKKLLLLICLAAALTSKASAQEIAVNKGWKFAIGDSMDWAAPAFDDSNWKAIDLAHDWESQGYKGEDGFGWYRLHLVIPSSLKQRSFL